MIDITNKQNINKWSSVPDEYWEEFGEEGDFYRQYLLNPNIFKLLGDISGKKILDAGCGNGYLSRMMAKIGALVTGVEPGESMHQYAKRREEQEKLGITYLQQDLSQLDIPEEFFDAVVSNVEVKEYLQEYSTKEKFGYSFHRPLSAYINFVIEQGCQIEEIVEPILSEELIGKFPEHDKDAHIPGFIIIKAKKYCPPSRWTHKL